MNNPRNQPLRILPIPRPLDHHDLAHRLLLHLDATQIIAKFPAMLAAILAIGPIFFAKAVETRLFGGEGGEGGEYFVGVGCGLGGSG